jgi:hypothetical protein
MPYMASVHNAVQCHHAALQLQCWAFMADLAAVGLGCVTHRQYLCQLCVNFQDGTGHRTPESLLLCVLVLLSLSLRPCHCSFGPITAAVHLLIATLPLFDLCRPI